MEKIVSAQDLPALEPVMMQADNACTARHVSFDDFLKLFDEEVHGKIRGAALGPGVTHVVCLENLDTWSSRYGHRVALTVGIKPEGKDVPTWTLEDVLGTKYFRLGDVPSRFQYPVCYAGVESLKKEGAGQGQFDLNIKEYGG